MGRVPTETSSSPGAKPRSAVSRLRGGDRFTELGMIAWPGLLFPQLSGFYQPRGVAHNAHCEPRCPSGQRLLTAPEISACPPDVVRQTIFLLLRRDGRDTMALLDDNRFEGSARGRLHTDVRREWIGATLPRGSALQAGYVRRSVRRTT